MKNKKKFLNVFFFLLASVIAGYITYRIASNRTTNLDAWAEPFVSDLNEQGMLFTIFRWITELGSATFLVPFSLVMAVLIWWLSRNWLMVTFFASGAIIGPYLVTVIKNLVQRERPRILEMAEGEGYSFPSGHAMSSMIIYGMLIYFFTILLKKSNHIFMINTVFVLLILLIGLSRYIIRVHHLSDVLAGFSYGFIFIVIWLGLFHWVHLKIFNENPSSPS